MQHCAAPLPCFQHSSALRVTVWCRPMMTLEAIRSFEWAMECYAHLPAPALCGGALLLRYRALGGSWLLLGGIRDPP